MAHTPRVSIITPSYNQAAFLEQTILSVFHQGYPDLEYIVVDGGSTDGSLNILNKYAPALTWWVSEPDQGQADAINKGFSHATGEVVAWLNSDDLYLEGAVQAAVDYLQAEPGCGFVYGDVLSLGEGNLPIHLQHFDQYSQLDLMKFQIIAQPAVFMRRTAIPGDMLLDGAFKYLLDHHLWLRVAQGSAICYSGQLWAAARYHAAAKNVAQARYFGAEAFKLVEWMADTPGLASLYQENKTAIMAGAERLNAYYLSVSGAPRQALGAYWRSFCHMPGKTVREWKRILYTLSDLVGLSGLARRFEGEKKRRLSQIYQKELEFIQPSLGAVKK